MPLNRKVVWNEGMFLSPHHFQQWDRYHQGLLNFRLSSLVSHTWGITELKINVESLKNGKCEIEVCTSVLPDGLAFSFPETDQTPTPPHPLPTKMGFQYFRLDTHGDFWGRETKI